MINNEIIKLLKSFHGPVMASVAGKDDYVYVKVVKSDLLDLLVEKGVHNELGLGITFQKGCAFFGRDYNIT